MTVCATEPISLLSPTADDRACLWMPTSVVRQGLPSPASRAVGLAYRMGVPSGDLRQS